jgi:uncharacterized protein Yka (UPF0111/DUF47 family)
MDFVHLVGTEGVENAGRRITDAAESIGRSVSHLGELLEQHRRQMEEILAIDRVERQKPNGE